MNDYYSYGSGTTSTATAGNNWTTTTQDGFGRAVMVQTGTGSTPGAAVISEVDITYLPCACSPMGKKSAQHGPYLGSGGPSVAYLFDDALGRTTSTTAADGSVTNYAYQGNFTSMIDPAGNWKQFASDAFGNLTAVIEPDPNANPLVTSPPSPPAYPVTSPPTGTLLTSFNYDLVNHLATTGSVHAVTMPRGANTQTRDLLLSSHHLHQRRPTRALVSLHHQPGERHRQLHPQQRQQPGEQSSTEAPETRKPTTTTPTSACSTSIDTRTAAARITDSSKPSPTRPTVTMEC